MRAPDRVRALILALLCGIAVPLSPLGAEFYVTRDILPSSWSAVAVTYVAGIGLVSADYAIRIGLVAAAGALAFLYGVDLKAAFDHAPATATSSVAVVKTFIAIGSALYATERVWRHIFKGEPFLEP